MSSEVLAAVEEQVDAEANLLAAKGDLAGAGGGGGGEPATFVELLVVGQERLGHHAEDSAAVQHGGAVEHLIVQGKRQADAQQAGKVGGFLQDGLQGGTGAFE